MNKEKTSYPESGLSDYELELEKIVEKIKNSTIIEGIALLKNKLRQKRPVNPNTEPINVTVYSGFQLCPKCNGQGIVSRPPWIAGDIESWMSSESSYECNLCHGKMIIPISNE